MLAFFLSNLGGSEIIILFSYLAMALLAYFVIQGVKAFFKELNK